MLTLKSALKLSALTVLGTLAVVGPSMGAGTPGTTLAAVKTIDICSINETTWRYSGEVAVWNSGAVDTVGFQIYDHVQHKSSGSLWTDVYTQTLGAGQVIPKGTTQLTALVFPYNMEGPALSGDIRNVADVTILNHAGHITTPPSPFGPSPKATYAGPIPPPACVTPPAGCTYTQGYWGNKPGVAWPQPYDRGASFYYSAPVPLTWQNVLTNPPVGNGYYILGSQFISAVLNVANGAAVPSGVQDILTQATTWFDTQTNSISTCSAKGSCGTQKDWGAILDSYNNGVYPGGPPHCGNE